MRSERLDRGGSEDLPLPERGYPRPRASRTGDPALAGKRLVQHEVEQKLHAGQVLAASEGECHVIAYVDSAEPLIQTLTHLIPGLSPSRV